MREIKRAKTPKSSAPTEGEYAFPVILACVSGNLMPLMCQTNSLDTFCKCPYKSMK